jgi:myosin heavy subunit
MQKAMENMKFSMEDFAQQIDQTLQLLEDIKKEQTMQKALQIAEEMEKMQGDLNERTAEGSESSERLAEEQSAQQKKLEELQQQMEEAAGMLDPKKDSKISEQMQSLMESGMMDSLSSDIDSASEQLQAQEMTEAQQSQQSAMSKMQKLRSQLENMSSMMSMMGSMAMGEALDDAIRSFIFMSMDHQKVQERYSRDPFVILADLISEQEGINLTLQKLYSVPMIVLALGPKFVYDVNYTMTTFRELFQYINDAKSTGVSGYLGDIQKGINLVIYDLMQSSQNMQQGGGGGGMQSLMQQLQQMSEEQMMMNMMTQQIYQQMMETGKPSQQMREEMQRLAGEEQRLADNLRRMLQNDQEAQKQTGAINQMIEDLEAISRNLKQGRITQDLLDTQERILSRLLDAQKSIHKRDISKQRKSESSEFLDWDTPEEIKQKFDKLRQKALLEENYQDYPPEYQELIREYLKRLNE